MAVRVALVPLGRVVVEVGVMAILFKVTAAGVLPPPPHPESCAVAIIEKAASSNLV